MPWSRNRPAPTTRGVGHEHRKQRALWAARHQPTDPCVRCGHPLGPMGPHLHLDHNRARDGYLGFSHGRPCPWCGKPCNLSAGGKEGRARQTATRLRW